MKTSAPGKIKPTSCLTYRTYRTYRTCLCTASSQAVCKVNVVNAVTISAIVCLRIAFDAAPQQTLILFCLAEICKSTRCDEMTNSTPSADWRACLTASERYDNIQKMYVVFCFPRHTRPTNSSTRSPMLTTLGYLPSQQALARLNSSQSAFQVENSAYVDSATRVSLCARRHSSMHGVGGVDMSHRTST